MCVDSRDLGSFVDDELPGGERLWVARHLETCRECADEAAWLRELGERLRVVAPAEPRQGVFAGLAASVVSRSTAESQQSWRGWMARACDGWHWAIVGSGSVAATFISTSILSLILTFGPAPAREDSLSALMVNLATPAGDFFIFGSPVGNDQNMSLLQVDNGRPTASRMVAAMALPPSHRPMSEAELVWELDSAVTQDGRVLALGSMDRASRRRTEALLDELARLRSSTRQVDDNRSFTVREMRLVTSVTAKSL